MKKYLYTIILLCLLLITGCSKSEKFTTMVSHSQRDNANVVGSSMGCSDSNCTDSSHYHDCSSDCTEVEHHHVNDVYEDSHHDDSTVTNVSFVSGMGCNDSNCTDSSHHHDCPSDCEDYSHHHNCSLDCTEARHHHNNTKETNKSEQHHQKKHHASNHR